MVNLHLQITHVIAGVIFTENNYARELCKGILWYNYGHTSIEVLSDDQ